MEDWFVPHQPGSLPPARRVLVIAPHADDETFGCGGALALYREAGAEVRVLVLTDGAGYEAAPERGAIDEARRAETRAALACLGGADAEFLGLPDRGLAAQPDLARTIALRAADFTPEVVFAPSPWEVHPDHRAAARAALAAWEAPPPPTDAGRAPQVLLYEVGALQRPDLLVDVTAAWPRKAAAMAAYATQQQRQDYARHITGLNTYRAYTLPSQVLYAEAFRRAGPFGEARARLSSMAPAGAVTQEGGLREVAALWAQESLVAAEVSAERVQAHLAQRERDWAQRERDWAQREQALTHAQQVLKAELRELGAALDQRQGELEALRRQHEAERDALDAQLRWSRQEVQGLAASHEAARQRIEQLEADVRGLMHSTSWRVTAPLRWLSRKLGRGA